MREDCYGFEYKRRLAETSGASARRHGYDETACPVLSDGRLASVWLRSWRAEDEKIKAAQDAERTNG